jgi:protein DGCR14
VWLLLVPARSAEPPPLWLALSGLGAFAFALLDSPHLHQPKQHALRVASTRLAGHQLLTHRDRFYSLHALIFSVSVAGVGAKVGREIIWTHSSPIIEMDSQPQPSASSALVRKRAEMDLMPPPPQAKKIKRPKQVLDEDSYTEALSHIIARDFFPGLLETEIQQEYLDAVDSNDSAWISSARRRLEHVMTPGRRKGPLPAGGLADGGRTPSTQVGATPMSNAGSTVGKWSQPDMNMSLSNFQAKYTSEDNESFYKLVDKQNQKRADKYAWLWRGNKLPSKQMIKQKEVETKLLESRSLVDDGFKRDRLAIKDVDQRPAQPDTWNAAPKNGLMFGPDGVADDSVTVAQTAEQASKMGPKTIIHANTRMPQPHVPQRPPSPTMSSIRDAISGRTRPQDQNSTAAGGGETPRVNGYAFVDDEDEPEPAPPLRPLNLGPGDAVNPFKVQDQRERETLHERMVERIARSKRESSTNGFTGKVEATPTPKFPSSPRVTGDLTPAAQRLWSKIGSPARRDHGSPFGQTTPARPRGSLLRGAVKQTPKSAK